MSQENAYRIHMRTHESVKRRVCDLCGKGFSTSVALKVSQGHAAHIQFANKNLLIKHHLDSQGHT
jgi:hypothetical protein